MTAATLRPVLVSVLITPWLYLILFLTLIFVAADIGSIDQGKSGLIAIATGENGRWLTCCWFLAALSIVTLPFFVLWQEQAITQIERSGYLPLLLTSRLHERSYRESRLRASFVLVIVVLTLTGFLGAVTLAGLELTTGGSLQFLLAGLAVHAPNLIAGSMLAASLTRMNDRAIALAIGGVAPIAMVTIVGITADLIPAGDARLFYTAIEPTGTLYFSELYRDSLVPGWGEPAMWQLIPFVANRFLVVAGAVWLGRRYLTSVSVFERSDRDERQARPFFRRLSPLVTSSVLATIAALMTVSNIHSNFTKNLQFYEIHPHMGFLVAAALSDIHVYLVAAMVLLVGKLAWESRESGFDVLETSGRLSGMGVIARAAVHVSVAIVIWLVAVIGAVTAMFSGHFGAFSIRALLEYAALVWLPGLLLVTSIFYLISLSSPNRLIGYFLTIGACVGYLAARSGGFLALPFSLFADSPGWSELSRQLTREPSSAAAAVARIGVTLALAGVAGLLAGRWRRREPSWISRRTMRGSLSVTASGLALLLVSIGTSDLASSDERRFVADAQTSARYETVAETVQHPAAWEMTEARHFLDERPDGGAVLTSTLALRSRGTGVGLIPITWGVTANQITVVRANGVETNLLEMAPGLFAVDGGADEVELTLEARFSETGSDVVVVHSLHGSWPTMPVVGVLPELFLRDASAREDLGLPPEIPDVGRFHPDGLSRPAVDTSIEVGHPCRSSAALPFVAQRLERSDECTATMTASGVRYELLVATGPWDRLSRAGDHGSVEILFPSHQIAPASRLLSASVVAKEAVSNALRRDDLLDLTIVAGGIEQLGSSNALSKPGIILVSDVMILNSALRDEERRRRYVTLMAHEIAHQWFGPARTGTPGAIFVNEVPAEIVRAYVTTEIFGDEAFRRYLQETASRMDYEIRTQRTPDGAAIDAVETDEIYYRAAVLGAFIASRLGWNGLLDNLSAVASEHSYAKATTSRDIAERLMIGLDEVDRDFARLLIESDTTFESIRGRLSYSCSENCPDEAPTFPVPGDTGGLTWMAIEDVDAEELKRSPLGPLVITR